VWDPAASNLLGVFTFCGDGGRGPWFWHASQVGSLEPGSVPSGRGVAPAVAGHSLTLQPQPSGPLVVSASTGQISPTNAHRLGQKTCRWDGSRYRCLTS